MHLQKELDAIGMSQAEFARWIGYSPRHVNSWVKGRPVPKHVLMLLNYCKRYGAI